MIHKVIDTLFGSKNEHDIAQLLPIVRDIEDREAWAMALTNDEIPQWTQRLRDRVHDGETPDQLLPEAFALVREAARRKLGERLYEVQLMGGVILHQGKIMEMKTGEGKTVSSVTAAYLNALSGRGVHIVTVNDYLAERDANWMRPVYTLLGISVGFILSDMAPAERQRAYRCDITYGTNNEFGFDYLRDNMRFDINQKVQQHHHYCIIDEIDSILIDEARTPLIISGTARDDVRRYSDAHRLSRQLVECAKDPETEEYPEEPIGDYKIEEKNKRISFTDQGLNHMEEILQSAKLIKSSLFSNENFAYIHHFTQALRAQKLYMRDREYVVKEGSVQIVDEFTGRILHGRRYSEGLHQAIEAKEEIAIAQRNRTLATITFQNFFRMYDKISGMTGTAETEAKEFGNIYGLDVVVIPTNRPVKREDNDDLIYVDEEHKYRAICDEIDRVHRTGQPMLVGTVSIAHSEKLSELLRKRGIRHEVLNAKNHAREALIISEAGANGAITIATNMAGRGTDIKLGGNPEFRARIRAGTNASEAAYETAYTEELRHWREQYEKVRSLDGLYVLGTERHESRRIDNQLRGRSGRQGDTGHSRFYLSMDDDLLRLFGRGGERIKAIMSHGMDPNEALNHSLINSSIERAQLRVEERNFDIRKHLLEYDDVVNEQRKVIYQQRNAILRDDNLIERVLNIGREQIQQIVETHDEPMSANSLRNIVSELRSALFYHGTIDDAALIGLSREATIKRIGEIMAADLQRKAEEVDLERFNLAIRHEYLHNIDIRWQEHLENLESLREAVYLRSYGQRNPLLEYKLEGFQIFDQLIANIRVMVGRKLFAVSSEGFQTGTTPVQKDTLVARHNSAQMFGQTGTRQPTATRAATTLPSAERQTTRRIQPKVGRNDPCPCGSGKKYKFCHGR